MKKELIKPFPDFRFLSRREMLLLIGGTFAVSLNGGAGVKSKELERITGCLVSPEQTAGPFFVDEKLNRSDIRMDPWDGSVKKGVNLGLTLNVFQVLGSKCEPLSDGIVDIWHCDASGLYSDVDDFNADTRGQKFLRGFQKTDQNGQVKFKTIYPGWYGGRTVHIHFKIRKGTKHFTSQLYFDDSITAKVYNEKPYSEREKPDTTNESDGIFRFGGKLLMLNLTKDGQGYAGEYNVGFQMG